MIQKPDDGGMRLRMKEIAESYYPYVNNDNDNGKMWAAMLEQFGALFDAELERKVVEELESIVGWRSDAKDAVLIKPEYRHLPLAENVDMRHQMLVHDRIAQLRADRGDDA